MAPAVRSLGAPRHVIHLRSAAAAAEALNSRNATFRRQRLQDSGLRGDRGQRARSPGGSLAGIMARGRFLCLLALLEFPVFQLCASARARMPDITDPEFIKAFVDEHNKFRSAVNPPASNMLYMTWDPSLARVARAWGRRCLFDHNIYLSLGNIHPKFRSAGENLWKGGGYPGADVVVSWNSEVKNYDFAKHTCSAVCGHYTQVVWATSYKLGCAATRCDGGHSVIVTCNYGPSGNFRGVKPYKDGAPCSQCPNDRCENNLCRDEERDKIVYLPHWYPHFDSTSWYADLTCDLFCISVLSLRLFFVPVIFIVDIYIHRYYPDMITRK
ncbi:glioma pathogenesis-related protein 1-like [Rhinatrema bivittatum]|uniref:glioma pathogenesis-related protein 1-like n=1 Tax=Rhinatrema bivittatum TaxID=194408 RepID=UPI00112B1338|nr:glioma pathogenesis-related protein 1-like [Rhinatrema bivittatum]